jgi:hypothetical protein
VRRAAPCLVFASLVLVACASDAPLGTTSTTITADTRTSSESAAALLGEDLHGRYDHAKALAKQGKFDEALAEYLWVWDATRDAEAWLGVRHSFLLSDMSELADGYPPAGAAMLALVEKAQANMEVVDPIRWIDWVEWTSLCDRFTGGGGSREWYDPPRDGQGRIADWYDRHRDAAGRITVPTDAKLQERIEDNLFGVLARRGRFVDAVRAGGDLIARVVEEGKSIQALEQAAREGGAPPAEAAEFLDNMRAFFVQRQAPVCGVLFAAGEANSAKAFGRAMLDAVDTAEARRALVASALDRSATRDAQLGIWLDEAAAMGADVADLRARLASAPPR